MEPAGLGGDMREIKFRAWDSCHDFMMSWGILNQYDEDGHTCFLDILDGTYSEIIPMQYTGLKDSKGVEIYEGDIAKKWYGPRDEQFFPCLVIWRGNSWKIKDPNRYEYYFHEIFPESMEIIGNIYENPELLK